MQDLGNKINGPSGGDNNVDKVIEHQNRIFQLAQEEEEEDYSKNLYKKFKLDYDDDYISKNASPRTSLENNSNKNNDLKTDQTEKSQENKKILSIYDESQKKKFQLINGVDEYGQSSVDLQQVKLCDSLDHNNWICDRYENSSIDIFGSQPSTKKDWDDLYVRVDCWLNQQRLNPVNLEETYFESGKQQKVRILDWNLSKSLQEPYIDLDNAPTENLGHSSNISSSFDPEVLVLSIKNNQLMRKRRAKLQKQSQDFEPDHISDKITACSYNSIQSSPEKSTSKSHFLLNSLQTNPNSNNQNHPSNQNNPFTNHNNSNINNNNKNSWASVQQKCSHQDNHKLLSI